MIFEYDRKKNQTNIEKHGVDFEEAATVFYDPLVKIKADRSQKEERLIAIGHSSRGNFLFVVYCERGNEADQEIIRIISARKVTRAERRSMEGL